jgi:hypothetical protein
VLGGVVIEISSTGKYGLVSAVKNQGDNMNWYTVETKQPLSHLIVSFIIYLELLYMKRYLKRRNCIFNSITSYKFNTVQAFYFFIKFSL